MYKKVKSFVCIAMVMLLCTSLVYAENGDNPPSRVQDKNQVIKEVKEKTEIKRLRNKKRKTIKSQGFPLDKKQNIEVSNKIVIKLKNMKDLKKLKISENISSTYENLSTVTIDIPEGIDTNEVLKKYKQSSIVEQAYIEPIVRLFYTPPDPYFNSYQWNLKKIDMESAWNNTKGHSSVVVAVIDTGFGPFSDVDSVLNGVDVSQGTILEDTYPGQYSYDGSEHGTAVSSLISSNMNTVGIAGIAPDVSILPVKVFPNGSEETGSTQIAAGIRWAADHGADLINLSLGSDYSSPLEEEAIHYALSKNVIVVAASGNEGYGNFVSYPAAYDGVIAVGSSDSFDTISYFSNEGSELDIVAPGESILLPYLSGGINSYISYDGTSFSSPTVCAVASLVKSKYPNYSNKMIEQILYQSAQDIDIYGWDFSSGYGRINAGKAMKLAADNRIFDGNDDKKNATIVYANKNYEGKMYPIRDEDYYKFTLLEPYIVSIEVTPLNSLQDMVLELSDSNGILLIEDSADAGGRELLNYYLEAGTYYINAYEYWGDVYEESYNLNLRVNDTTPPIIFAFINGQAVSDGITTESDVMVQVEDTSYQEISIERNNAKYNWPKDGLFSELGKYSVQAVDSKGNISNFQFTIANDTLYSISFDSQGGTSIDGITANYGNKITAPTVPTKAGYNFGGWYKEASYTNEWDFSKDFVSADTTLYAKWNIIEVSTDGKFTDVPTNHWAYEFIKNLADKNIINGYEDGSFKPNNKLTRAQAASMIVKAAGIDYKGKVSNFIDVPPTNWASAYIAAAKDAGILNGYGDRFKPNDNVTRAQIAVMISKAFDLKNTGEDINFKDVPDNHWSNKYVEILASNNIVSGYEDRTFKPNNHTTRAQFSKILSIAMEK